MIGLAARGWGFQKGQRIGQVVDLVYNSSERFSEEYYIKRA